MGPFVCSDCGQRHEAVERSYRAGGGAEAPTKCRACGEGPLLDVRDPEVVKRLRADDDERRRKRLPLRFPYLEEAAAPPPASVAAILDRARQRRKKQVRTAAIGGVAAAVVLVAGAKGFAAWQKRGRDGAWRGFATCVVGAPLGSGETPEARVRRIELARGAVADSATPGGEWPARCMGYADALYERLSAHDETADLRARMGRQLACAPELGSDARACKLGDLRTQVEGLWEAAGKAGLPVGAPLAEGVPAAPEPVPPLVDAKAFGVLGDDDAPIVDYDRLAGGAVRLLLHVGRDRLRVCDVPATGAASCRDVGEDAPGVPSLVRGQGEPVIAGVVQKTIRAAERRAFRVGAGQTTPVRFGRAGYLLDGFDVERPGDTDALEHRLLRVEGGVEVRSEELKLPAEASAPFVIGDRLGYVTSGDRGQSVVVWRKLSRTEPSEATGGKPPPMAGDADAGADVPFVHAPRVCTVDPTASVALFRASYAEELPAMTFLAVGAEPKTVRLAAGTPVPQASKPSDDGDDAIDAPLASSMAAYETFVCTKDAAALTWRVERRADQGGPVVNHLRCTPAGCTREEITPKNLTAQTFWVATDLGGKVLLVWRGRMGELRMRLAVPAELAEARDVIVMDSPDRGGPDTGDLGVAVHGDTAFLFFRGNGRNALRIRADGTFDAVR